MIPQSLSSLPHRGLRWLQNLKRRVDESGIMIIPRCPEFYGNMEVKPLIQFVRRTNKWIHLLTEQRNFSWQSLYPNQNGLLISATIEGVWLSPSLMLVHIYAF